MIIIILNCSSIARMIDTVCALLHLDFINFPVHFMLTFSDDSYFKIFLIDKKKGIILFFIILITTYLSFFRQVKINSIYPNYIERVNKFGIINSISYRISFDRENNKIIANIDNVENAIELLKEVQNKRDISNLIMPYDYTNKRNVFIIFMESFYDYSHFYDNCQECDYILY